MIQSRIKKVIKRFSHFKDRILEQSNLYHEKLSVNNLILTVLLLANSSLYVNKCVGTSQYVLSVSVLLRGLDLVYYLPKYILSNFYNVTKYEIAKNVSG